MSKLVVEELESRTLQANLSVVVLSWDMHSIVGDQVEYYVTVISYGGAENVTLEAIIPSGITFTSARDDEGIIVPISQSIINGNNHLLFDLGTFDNTYDEGVYIDAVIEEVGTFTTQMKVATSSPEPILGNNTRDITFVAAPKNLPETSVVSLEQSKRQLRLTFSAPLDPTSAQESMRYGLIQLTRFRGSRQLHIKGIVYNEETKSVTLQIKEKLPLRYMLTVTSLLDINKKEVVRFVHKS